MLLFSLPIFIPVNQDVSNLQYLDKCYMLCTIWWGFLTLDQLHYIQIPGQPLFSHIYKDINLIPWNIIYSCHPQPSSLSRPHIPGKPRISQIRDTTNKRSPHIHDSLLKQRQSIRPKPLMSPKSLYSGRKVFYHELPRWMPGKRNLKKNHNICESIQSI